MAVVKVIEILAEGKSIEDAINVAVKEASRTVKNIRSVYLKDTQALIKGGKVDGYRVNTKISFIVGK